MGYRTVTDVFTYNLLPNTYNLKQQSNQHKKKDALMARPSTVRERILIILITSSFRGV